MAFVERERVREKEKESVCGGGADAKHEQFVILNSTVNCVMLEMWAIQPFTKPPL